MPKKKQSPQPGGTMEAAVALPRAIVLNGTSSSGKTSISKRLQEILLPTYLGFSIDTILYALPPSDLRAMMAGAAIRRPDYDFDRLVRGFHAAAASLLQAGNRLIIDNATAREEWRADLIEKITGYDVFWVGVHCDAAVAAGRESARGDRAIGTAAREAPLVHRGFQYDFEVDTSNISSDRAAAMVAQALSAREV